MKGELYTINDCATFYDSHEKIFKPIYEHQEFKAGDYVNAIDDDESPWVVKSVDYYAGDILEEYQERGIPVEVLSTISDLDRRR